jgi:hypothetical protein
MKITMPINIKITLSGNILKSDESSINFAANNGDIAIIAC